MKRRIGALLIALVLMLTAATAMLPAAMAAETGGDLILKVHCNRPDGKAEVAPISAMVLVKEDKEVSAPASDAADSEDGNGSNPTGVVIGVGVLVLAAGGCIAAVMAKNSKKKKS